MGRRLTLAALLLLLPASGWAQNGSFIRYHPPGGGGSGSGDCDPAQWSTTDGIVFGGIVGACTAGIDGSTRGQFASGTGTVPATGVLGDSYFETDAELFSVYVNTDTPITLFDLGKNLPVANLNSGTSASATTFWRGDGTWATPAGGSAFDPSTTLHLNEEFFAGSLTTTTTIGSTGMTVTLIASGTVTLDVGTATNPGVLRLIPAAGDNSGASTYWSAAKFDAAIWSNYDWTLDGGAAFNSGVSNDYFFFGLSTSCSAVLTTAAAIGIVRDTDLSHSAFVAVSCDANSANGCQAAGDDTDQQSALSTITPVAGTTGYRFRVSHDANGGPGGTRKISIQVQDETPITFCSSGCTDTIDDLPAVVLSPCVAKVARSTSLQANYLQLDYLDLTIGPLSRFTP